MEDQRDRVAIRPAVGIEDCPPSGKEGGKKVLRLLPVFAIKKVVIGAARILAEDGRCVRPVLVQGDLTIWLCLGQVRMIILWCKKRLNFVAIIGLTI